MKTPLVAGLSVLMLLAACGRQDDSSLSSKNLPPPVGLIINSPDGKSTMEAAIQILPVVEDAVLVSGFAKELSRTQKKCSELLDKAPSGWLFGVDFVIDNGALSVTLPTGENPSPLSRCMLDGLQNSHLATMPKGLFTGRLQVRQTPETTP